MGRNVEINFISIQGFFFAANIENIHLKPPSDNLVFVKYRFPWASPATTRVSKTDMGRMSAEAR